MNTTFKKSCALIGLLLLPIHSFAQSCDAYYSFDGNLSDQGGGGYDGTMIGKEGIPALAQFADGIDGQALQLDGRSAMRASLDLNPELCPQVTVTAWVRVEAEVRGTQYLLSTGAGSGPGLRSSGKIAVLTGTGNGISHRDAIRDGRAWFFFAGVYDYQANTYRFHWRNRVVEGELAESRRPPEDAFWVGAFNDKLDYAIKGADVDELRVIGKALTPEEVARMRGDRPSAFVKLVGDDGSSAAGIPQPIPGISDRFGGREPLIDADDLPERPPDLLGGGVGNDDGPLLDTPDGLGAARDGRRDPNLTPLGPNPGQEFQDDLAMAQEAALKEMEEKRISDFENSFGLKNRTQVVIGAGKDIAYAGIPTKLLIGPEGRAYGPPDLGVSLPSGPDSLPVSALPNTPSAANDLADSLEARNDVREVFRFQGEDAFMIINAAGETTLVGDAKGLQNPVRNRIQTVLRSGRPIDLVANYGAGYLLVSGTSVHARDVPQPAIDWAKGELSNLRQVTAMTFMPGDAWIGVSVGEVGSGGMNRSHWGLDLLTDVRRLVAEGEKIHDISVTSQSATVGSWAIATNKSVYFRQEPTGRFPSCRQYQMSNDELKPRNKADHEFGEVIADELGREWSCWYPKLNCLAKYPTWSETDMGSPPNTSRWDVNLLVTIGVPLYEGIEKEIVDCWLDDQLQKTEDVFRHSPSLKFKLKTEYKKVVDGVDIVNYNMDSGSAHGRFMDRNFDVQAKSKTEGYYPILVSHRPCIGFKDGIRKCGSSRATFPHSVNPLSRKHGILLLAERTREEVLAHEFGHYLSLKHTFEPYLNPIGDLNCNKRYTPKGGEVRCNSCLSPGSAPAGVCSGTYNVMDYCDGDVDDADLNFCQQSRGVNQRQRYLTRDGRTNYAKMKGRLGEPYCSADSDCLDDEYCNTGVLGAGRNVCKSTLSSGAVCSRGGQCESGKCPFLICQ